MITNWQTLHDSQLMSYFITCHLTALRDLRVKSNVSIFIKNQFTGQSVSIAEFESEVKTYVKKLSPSIVATNWIDIILRMLSHFSQSQLDNFKWKI